MSFSVHTLLALLASIGLVITGLRHVSFVFVMMMAVLPICMVVIGITSPQQGNQLDPSRRWYLFLIGKIWLFTLMGYLLLCLLAALFPPVKVWITRYAWG